MIWLITPTGYWELHIKYILLLTYMFIKCNMYKWFFMFKNKAVNVFPCWLLFCKLWKVKLHVHVLDYTIKTIRVLKLPLEIWIWSSSIMIWKKLSHDLKEFVTWFALTIFKIMWPFFSQHVLRIDPLQIQISNSSCTLVVLIVIPSDTVYFIIFIKNLFLTKLESNFPFFLHTVHKL